MIIHINIRKIFCIAKKNLIVSMLLLMTSLPSLAFSANYIFLNVPFIDKVLNPKDVIQVGYSFGNYLAMLCYVNNSEKVGKIQWTYKGSTKSSSLPVELKFLDGVTGKFADKKGTITITNTTNKQLVVGCVF